MGWEQRQFDSKLILFTSQTTQIWLQADLAAKQNYWNVSANLSKQGKWIERGRSCFGPWSRAQCKHGPFSGVGSEDFISPPNPSLGTSSELKDFSLSLNSSKKSGKPDLVIVLKDAKVIDPMMVTNCCLSQREKQRERQKAEKDSKDSWEMPVRPQEVAH